MTASKLKHRESTIWQRRFWEHQIRDETDFIREIVAEEKDEAVDVELVKLVASAEVGLAVGAQADAVDPVFLFWGKKFAINLSGGESFFFFDPLSERRGTLAFGQAAERECGGEREEILGGEDFHGC